MNTARLWKTNLQTIQSGLTEPFSLLHMSGMVFCADAQCFCHRSGLRLAYVNKWIQEGLLGERDRELLVTGRTV